MQSWETPQPQFAAPQGLSTEGFFISGSTLDSNYGPHYRGRAGGESQSRWLGDTALLQIEHPKIRLLALKLTQLKCGDREKAVTVFEFVRNLHYSFSSDAMRMPSVEVLAGRTGDGFSKSTLFIALLRSMGIAARLRVVLLRPGYLRGITAMDRTLLEHAFTEVLLEGQWLAVDSYVADLRLAFNARSRLLDEQRVAGYGIHLRGQLSWNGRASCFGQFASGDATSLPMIDLGAHEDVQQFYRALTRTRLSGWSNRKRWAFASVLANRRIHNIRVQDRSHLAAPSTTDRKCPA